ncbi:hypothetical protein Peur_022787 [Populus x canadensis]
MGSIFVCIGFCPTTISSSLIVTDEPRFKVGPDRAQWVGDRIGARRSTGSWKNVWTSNFMKRWVGRRPWKGCSLAEMHTQNVHQALQSCGYVDMMAVNQCLMVLRYFDAIIYI